MRKGGGWDQLWKGWNWLSLCWELYYLNELFVSLRLTFEFWWKSFLQRVIKRLWRKNELLRLWIIFIFGTPAKLLSKQLSWFSLFSSCLLVLSFLFQTVLLHPSIATAAALLFWLKNVSLILIFLVKVDDWFEVTLFYSFSSAYVLLCFVLIVLLNVVENNIEFFYPLFLNSVWN